MNLTPINKKICFVIPENISTGAIGINLQVHEALKDEFKWFKVSPAPNPYYQLPIIGIILNYFTLQEIKNDFNWFIATSYAGLPFLESKHLIEIFHGVDSASLTKIKRQLNDGLLNDRILSKWLSLTESLYTEKIQDIEARQNIVKIVETACAQKADKIIAVSNNVKRDIVELFGVQPEKVEVILNGIPNFWFEKTDTSSKFGVVVTTRFNQRLFNFLEKGHDRAFEILSRLESIPKTIYASFNQNVSQNFRQAIKKIVKEETNSNFIDNLSGPNLKASYHPGSILLITSRSEACQLTLLEGMAAGLIPVTYPVGIAQDIIKNGENGFIIESIEEAIDIINKLKSDVKLRKKIIERAFETAQSQFTFTRMINDYRKVFKKIFEGE